MPKRKRPSSPDLSEDAQGKNYLDLCSKFAEITTTNNALAMAYLQDRNWDLEKAVADFLSQHGTNQGQTSVTFIDLTDSPEDENMPCTSKPPVTETVFNVLSWNVDGLDRKNIVQRTTAIASCLKSEPFHVVCLQEVTMETLRLFQTQLGKHYFIFSPTDNPFADCAHYFVAILIRRHHAIEVEPNSFQVHPYPNSTMGRHLASIDLIIDCGKFVSAQASLSAPVRVRIFTSHLESCREGSEQRKNQLTYAWKRMTQLASYSIGANGERYPQASLFCGDLNLRDKEVQDIGGVPSNVKDMWLATGSRPELCTTWDPQRNSNASRYGHYGRGPQRRPTFRYDRMYIHGSCLKAIDFGLRGLEKVPGAACFPSDHWGILGRFQLNPTEH